MWSRIKERLLQINTATGIEVVFQADEKLVIHACTVRLEKNTPVKKAKHKRLENYADLQVLKDRDAASVLFSGRGVLVKNLGDGVDREKALSSVLPQANPEEFYTQVEDFGQCRVVAIARKNLIDRSLAELEKLGLNILDFSLGFAPLKSILPFISPGADGRVETGSYTFTLKENSLWSFEGQAPPPHPVRDADEYLAGRQYLQGFDILPYAAATALLAGSLDEAASLDHKKVGSNREEYKYRKYLKSSSFFVLAFLFTVLLGNFFLYDHYFTLNKDLGEYQQASQKEISDQHKTDKALEEKENFFHEAGWLSQARTSFLADRFASFLPRGTGFTTLNFYPPGKSASSGNPSFTRDTIQISGWCDDPYQINLLMNNIKTLKEVQTVNLVGYSYRKNEEKGIFSLELTVKP